MPPALLCRNPPGMEAMQVCPIMDRGAGIGRGLSGRSNLSNLVPLLGFCSCGTTLAASSAFVDTALKAGCRTSFSVLQPATYSLSTLRFSSSSCTSRCSCCGISPRRNDHDRPPAFCSHRQFRLSVDEIHGQMNQIIIEGKFSRVRCVTSSPAIWRGCATRGTPETVFAPSQFIRSSPLQDQEDAIVEDFTDEGLSAPSSLLHQVHQQARRIFGPAIFNASKLRVLLPGKQDDERPWQHPRVYTLTHCDLTAEITLTVAHEINKSQVMGWYSKLQRDEVLAEWRRTQGEMSLHVHCHISGTNVLHTLIANLRFYMFQKELPLVIEAFLHGDRKLFKDHPELRVAPVWVYFHSNLERYNRVECWGPVADATKRQMHGQLRVDVVQTPVEVTGKSRQQFLAAEMCLTSCECCSRHATVIPISESLRQHVQQLKSQDASKLRML